MEDLGDVEETDNVAVFVADGLYMSAAPFFSGKETVASRRAEADDLCGRTRDGAAQAAWASAARGCVRRQKVDVPSDGSAWTP